jgi:hypothetical protein
MRECTWYSGDKRSNALNVTRKSTVERDTAETVVLNCRRQFLPTSRKINRFARTAALNFCLLRSFVANAEFRRSPVTK